MKFLPIAVALALAATTVAPLEARAALGERSTEDTGKVSTVVEADVIDVVACVGYCGQNRRVARRTARRTARRVDRRRDYYRGGGGYYASPGVVVYDDGPDAAAVGLAAGVAGMAVGAAIANSANNAPPPGNYPY